MSSSLPTTPFPLGAYVRNPDNSSSANEALFQSEYHNLATLMGVAPAFLTTFVDQTQTVGNWVGNSQWAANSMALAVGTGTTVPVIALPLSSTAAGTFSADQQFQAFASGSNDSVIKGIVQAWAQQGFKNLVFRPGWEMNIQGPTYAGDSAQSQADWVSAYQHVYTVLHQAAAEDGVNVTVVWNPSTTNYSNAEATTNLYPGNAYVDAIGADVYSDIHPYADSSGTPTYHDWDTGQEDSSVAQFIADPVNRMHYWSNPAATEWSNDGSGGHSQSLDSLIQFAKANGKPLAIPEAGAGASNNGVDVSDDAAFPQWLSQELTAAQNAGVKIDFVNLWDSNGGGNYQFSESSDNKPNEAAAWAKYFGAITAAVQTTASTTASAATSATTVLGSGSDTLALKLSEDAWQGDAQFTVSVDGQQIGGVQTVTASLAQQQTQTINVLGNFGTALHVVTIGFLNDAWGGSADADRNLYLDGATLDGAPVAGSSLTFGNGGNQSFAMQNTGLPVVANNDTLDLHLSEDAWKGNAQFTISIDGTTIGGVRTASASHAAGATNNFSIAGNWGSGAHTVGVTFLNDAWGGTASTDRNLYVDQLSYDGQVASGTPAALGTNDTTNFTVGVPTRAVTLGVQVSEDAWQGDARFTIAVDGQALTSNQVATALHSAGQSQGLSLQETFSVGTHDLAILFLNDAWGGSASTDRNLFILGAQVNGTAIPGATATLGTTSTDHFQFVVPSV